MIDANNLIINLIMYAYIYIYIYIYICTLTQNKHLSNAYANQSLVML